MLAFTFPGQGSQKPQMGAPWADHPSWELVDEASEATGRDVARLLLDAEVDELTETRNAQLATYVLSLVVLDAVERTGLEPAYAAGHSLGEYTALTAAGALAFDDGCELVAERGEAMQSAAEKPVGTMAAVLGLDDDQVDVACHRVTDDVWVANFNAPGQVVIAGSPAGIERASEVAKGLGAKRVMPVKVSGAFHTPYMAPARDRLVKALKGAEIRRPLIPVVANVDAAAHDDPADWTDLLAAQLCSPVRWRQTLSALEKLGVTDLVEIGPGTILTGMAKRTSRDARAVSVQKPDDVDGLIEAVAGPAPEYDAPTGEHLYATERLVVSPAIGLFRSALLVEGDPVDIGQVVGHVGDREVRSPFAGRLMRLLAREGERVGPSQPTAWISVAS